MAEQAVVSLDTVRPRPAGGHAVSWPPATAARAHADGHDLPLPFSSFVGRRRELADIEGLLAESRLVTLTGEPGMGKSRLALETARRLLAYYPDGAWQVELAGLTDPGMVPHAVAATLGGAGHAGTETATDALAADLAGRQLLVVLDNCEHLLDACAELARTLLEACPGLVVLATSQEPLGIPGERTWRVPPLAPPPPTGQHDPDALHTSEAVKLFCERANSHVGTFPLTEETVAEVAEICRRLDGNPLAIELAAARVGSLTPAEIRERLEHRFDLLTADPDRDLSFSGDVHSRHQTLEAAIAWSYELLAKPQRVLLRGLSVFAGQITLDAAEAVCADGHRACGGGLSADDVFSHLAGLVDRSLVVAEVAGLRARYRLLESIRAFAGERLDQAGEAQTVRSRFVDWAVALAEEDAAALTGPDQQDWGERLDADKDNLTAAVDYALADGHAEMALRLAGAMATFWRLRGNLREGRTLLERCLDAADEATPLVRARAAWGAGLLAAMLGDFAAARRRGEESLRAGEQAGDDAGAARALTLLGFVGMYQGDPRAAIRMLTHSVTLARRSGEDATLAAALDRCGQAHLLQGDAHSAQPLLEECYEVAHRSGDRQAEGSALLGQGWAAIDQGAYEVGEARVRLAEELARAVGDQVGTGEALAFLGELARRRGDLAGAERLFTECRELADATGVPLLQARSLSGLGRIGLTREDHDRAGELFDEAAGIARTIGIPYVLTRMLFGSAACATARGEGETAQVALDEALANARRHGDHQGVATATYALAVHAREDGDLARAGRLHAEALDLHVAFDDTETIARSLEGLGAVALDRGEPVAAARLFGAAAAALQRVGRHFARWPWEAKRHERDLGALEGVLGSEELERARQQGAERSLPEMVAYARRSIDARHRPTESPSGLTPAELDVARLVAQGMTSPETAERLFLSPRTVESHLQRIFQKLRINSRRQLGALAERLPELQPTE